MFGRKSELQYIPAKKHLFALDALIRTTSQLCIEYTQSIEKQIYDIMPYSVNSSTSCCPPTAVFKPKYLQNYFLSATTVDIYMFD